jgi:FkbM family methyltransferase
MSLDVRSEYEARIWLGLEERAELAALPRLLAPGDVFVDCGANLGLWSLVAVPLVRDRGKVVAFEPNPQTAERLSRNAAQASGVIDVRAIAVTDRQGRVRLDPGTGHNLSRVTPSGTIEVPATTLDRALDAAPTGIKIDVEGEELAILKGARRVLESRPWLAIEFSAEHAPGRRLGDWAVHAHLDALGYRAFSFRGEQLSGDWRLRRDYTNLLYRAPNGLSERGRPPSFAAQPAGADRRTADRTSPSAASSAWRMQSSMSM